MHVRREDPAATGPCGCVCQGLKCLLPAVCSLLLLLLAPAVVVSPCSDADRQAAKGMRLLQPATAADVLAEEREAAEQLLQQVDGQAAASSPLGSRPPSATSRAPPLPSGRRRSSNSAATTPTSAAAGGLTRRGSAPRPLAAIAPEEPHKPQCAVQHSTQECAAHSPPAAYTSLSAPPSATGSCRTTPEPHELANSIHRLHPQVGLQVHPRGFSTTPRDLGSSASCAGVPVINSFHGGGQHGEGTADTPSRQLYGEHSHGSVAAKQFLLQAQHQAIQQKAAWGLERQQLLSYPAPLLAEHSAAASTRTSVLYAVMALLGELDASSLHIVQREVQARLLEHQQH